MKSMLTSVCNCLEDGSAIAGLRDSRVNGQAKERRERWDTYVGRSVQSDRRKTNDSKEWTASIPDRVNCDGV